MKPRINGITRIINGNCQEIKTAKHTNDTKKRNIILSCIWCISWFKFLRTTDSAAAGGKPHETAYRAGLLTKFSTGRRPNLHSCLSPLAFLLRTTNPRCWGSVGFYYPGPESINVPDTVSFPLDKLLFFLIRTQHTTGRQLEGATLVQSQMFNTR